MSTHDTFHGSEVPQSTPSARYRILETDEKGTFSVEKPEQQADFRLMLESWFSPPYDTRGGLRSLAISSLLMSSLGQRLKEMLMREIEDKFIRIPGKYKAYSMKPSTNLVWRDLFENYGAAKLFIKRATWFPERDIPEISPPVPQRVNDIIYTNPTLEQSNDAVDVAFTWLLHTCVRCTEAMFDKTKTNNKVNKLVDGRYNAAVLEANIWYIIHKIGKLYSHGCNLPAALDPTMDAVKRNELDDTHLLTSGYETTSKGRAARSLDKHTRFLEICVSAFFSKAVCTDLMDRQKTMVIIADPVGARITKADNAKNNEKKGRQLNAAHAAIIAEEIRVQKESGGRINPQQQTYISEYRKKLLAGGQKSLKSKRPLGGFPYERDNESDGGDNDDDSVSSYTRTQDKKPRLGIEKSIAAPGGGILDMHGQVTSSADRLNPKASGSLADIGSAASISKSSHRAENTRARQEPIIPTNVPSSQNFDPSQLSIQSHELDVVGDQRGQSQFQRDPQFQIPPTQLPHTQYPPSQHSPQYPPSQYSPPQYPPSQYPPSQYPPSQYPQPQYPQPQPSHSLHPRGQVQTGSRDQANSSDRYQQVSQKGYRRSPQQLFSQMFSSRPRSSLDPNPSGAVEQHGQHMASSHPTADLSTQMHQAQEQTQQSLQLRQAGSDATDSPYATTSRVLSSQGISQSFEHHRRYQKSYPDTDVDNTMTSAISFVEPIEGSPPADDASSMARQ